MSREDLFFVRIALGGGTLHVMDERGDLLCGALYPNGVVHVTRPVTDEHLRSACKTCAALVHARGR